MSVYTVTQEEWQAVMGKNPSFFKGEKNLPVEQVSWDDCQAFIKKLRGKDKKLYRLPTEAEWEFCCRAGTKTPFHFGETISADQANYNSDFTYGDGKKGNNRKKTTPVGIFPGNAWKLHDMHGNVVQWCQDWSGDYPQEDVIDPQGPDKGEHRVLRGGSWFRKPQYCRSADRSWSVPGSRDILFRLPPLLLPGLITLFALFFYPLLFVFCIFPFLIRAKRGFGKWIFGPMVAAWPRDRQRPDGT